MIPSNLMELKLHWQDDQLDRLALPSQPFLIPAHHIRTFCTVWRHTRFQTPPPQSLASCYFGQVILTQNVSGIWVCSGVNNTWLDLTVHVWLNFGTKKMWQSFGKFLVCLVKVAHNLPGQAKETGWYCDTWYYLGCNLRVLGDNRAYDPPLKPLFLPVCWKNTAPHHLCKQSENDVGSFILHVH